MPKLSLCGWIFRFLWFFAVVGSLYFLLPSITPPPTSNASSTQLWTRAVESASAFADSTLEKNPEEIMPSNTESKSKTTDAEAASSIENTHVSLEKATTEAPSTNASKPRITWVYKNGRKVKVIHKDGVGVGEKASCRDYPNEAYKSAESNIKSHGSSPFTKNVRPGFIILIGDSTDRNIAKAKCLMAANSCYVGAAETSRHKKLFWQYMPNWDTDKGGHGLCYLPNGVILGWIFNVFGVHSCGPFPDSVHGIRIVKSGFAAGRYKKFVEGLCNQKHGANDNDGTDTKGRFSKLLKHQIDVMLEYVGALPETVAMNSNFWDLSRVKREEAPVFTQVVASESFRKSWLESWKANASVLIKLVEELLPSTKLAWRLSYYPTFLPISSVCVTGKQRVFQHFLLDELVKGINSAAVEMITTGSSYLKRVQIIDLPGQFPELQRHQKDIVHAVDEISNCYADHLIRVLVKPSAAEPFRETGCDDARIYVKTANAWTQTCWIESKDDVNTVHKPCRKGALCPPDYVRFFPS